MKPIKHKILIVGGGPAGIAAAVEAGKYSDDIGIIDSNPDVGGQIWRKAESYLASLWINQFKNLNIKRYFGSRVIAAPDEKMLAIEQKKCSINIEYEKLILATGARELFLPFPGWTIPGVFGVGGLQAMVKDGMNIDGKRIIVAGTSPLLWAAADYFQKEKAEVSLIIEQLPFHKILSFSLMLINQMGKLKEGMAINKRLSNTKVSYNNFIIKAELNNDMIDATDNKRKLHQCDYLAVGYNLVPNIELPMLLGCDLDEGTVKVDKYMTTSIDNIYAAGEITGIGGIEKSLIEGRIAGLTASEQIDQANRLQKMNNQQQNFMRLYKNTFKLNDRLKSITCDDTIVCRCEDIKFKEIKNYCSFREAKIHSRCGMGNCQGRVCGSTLRFIKGWSDNSIRPPLFPVKSSNFENKIFEIEGDN